MGSRQNKMKIMLNLILTFLTSFTLGSTPIMANLGNLYKDRMMNNFRFNFDYLVLLLLSLFIFHIIIVNFTLKFSLLLLLLLLLLVYHFIFRIEIAFLYLKLWLSIYTKKEFLESPWIMEHSNLRMNCIITALIHLHVMSVHVLQCALTRG